MSMVAVATIYDAQNPSGVAQRERISSNAITMESHCRVVNLNIKNSTRKHNMSPYRFSGVTQVPGRSSSPISLGMAMLTQYLLYLATLPRDVFMSALTRMANGKHRVSYINLFLSVADSHNHSWLSVCMTPSYTDLAKLCHHHSLCLFGLRLTHTRQYLPCPRFTPKVHFA